MEQKLRTICVDTLTGILDKMYMTSKKKPTHDKWMDWGQSIWTFISDLQDLGFEIIMILGDPGTGKSSGMRTLPSKTNIWFNADNKNPVWTGGKEEYGKKVNPKMPYHFIPKDYSEIIEILRDAVANEVFEEERYAILTAHTEEYKGENGVMRTRLKVIGNVSTKMQLEGKLETVLYARVAKEGLDTKYQLETENSGYNTARSPMGVFEPIIENDYNFVIQKLINS